MKKHLIPLLALGALAASSALAMAESAPKPVLPGTPALDQPADPALLPDPNAPADAQAAGPMLKFKIKGVNADDDEGEDGNDGEGHGTSHGEGQEAGEDGNG